VPLLSREIVPPLGGADVTPEGKVKIKVKNLLNAYGCYHFWAVQMGMGARTLDCLACHNGRAFAIETKAPGKHMTEQQKAIAERMEYSKCKVFEISSPDSLSELETWLRAVPQLDLFL
jgi:precorrin-6B methylase 2